MIKFKNVFLFLKNRISLSFLLILWNFITCIAIFISTHNFFNYFVKDYNNNYEELVINKTISSYTNLIMKNKNTININDNEIDPFINQLEPRFVSIENLTEKKIIYYNNNIKKLIHKLEIENNNIPIQADYTSTIKKLGPYYYLYVEKTLNIKDKLYKFKFIAERTIQINDQLNLKDKIVFSSILILILFLSISILILKFILLPIENIVEDIKEIDSNNLQKRIQVQWVPRDLVIIKNSFNSILNKLEESFQRLSQFSEDIAHELRTPVNNLKGEIEVSLQRKRSNKEYEEILESNLEECFRITEIIDSLTFLARTEKKDIIIQRTHFNLFQELNKLIELYESFAFEKNIMLTIECPNEWDVNLDKILFTRIISNLISNAIQYNKKNGKVHIKVEGNNHDLKITVSDTGIGIDKKHISFIFDRLYRVNNIRSSNQKNLGLGLSMVKNMILLHDGSINIESNLGEGTFFILYFPNSLNIS
ncbi:heavy metal sensor histidine kinase [Silvanigrella sp.]|uniref:heavy metal sensor histidine kinase n=1 Tax=Silvanigrella sp. TaxID=2024976 RepID=UPI0037C7C5B7